MGDLIRREDLLTSQFVHTECYLQANKDRHYDVYKKGWNDALQDAYDNAPAVDAVEVVRCQHCKHRFNGEHHDNCCDVLMEKVKWTFEVTVEPDWFCADGELGEGKTDG